MSFKRFLLGASIGFVVGAVLKDQLTSELITPEKALRSVKRKLAKQGVIEGSWIHMIPENYEKQLLDYTVYRGGVSCTIEGEFYQLDFIVDAQTGAILDLTSQN